MFTAAQAQSEQSLASAAVMKELSVVRSISVPDGESGAAPIQPISAQSSEDSEEESSEKKPSTEHESEVRRTFYVYKLAFKVILPFLAAPVRGHHSGSSFISSSSSSVIPNALLALIVSKFKLSPLLWPCCTQPSSHTPLYF